MLKDWHVLHSSEGDFVELVEVPLWAAVAGEAVMLADALTGHVLWGYRMPEWAWRVTVGTARVDETGDDFPANSLGALADRLFSWAHDLAFHRERVVHRFQVNVAATDEADAQAPDAS